MMYDLYEYQSIGKNGIVMQHYALNFARFCHCLILFPFLIGTENTSNFYSHRRKGDNYLFQMRR